MRGRDHTDDTDEERIINADGETSDYLKSVLDAEWDSDRSPPSDGPE
jgi:hypothetical protein